MWRLVGLDRSSSSTSDGSAISRASICPASSRHPLQGLRQVGHTTLPAESRTMSGRSSNSPAVPISTSNPRGSPRKRSPRQPPSATGSPGADLRPGLRRAVPELRGSQGLQGQEAEDRPRATEMPALLLLYLDREFGLMHVGWRRGSPSRSRSPRRPRVPRRQLEQPGIGFQKRDNCFVQIDDVEQGPGMLDDLVTRRWDHFLNAFAVTSIPCCGPSGDGVHGYYSTFRRSGSPPT